MTPEPNFITDINLPESVSLRIARLEATYQGIEARLGDLLVNNAREHTEIKATLSNLNDSIADLKSSVANQRARLGIYSATVTGMTTLIWGSLLGAALNWLIG